MRTRRPPAAIRTRLLRVVAATTATAVAALIVTFNVALQGVLDDQATSAAESRAVGVMSTLETAGGHVRAGEAPDGEATEHP